MPARHEGEPRCRRISWGRCALFRVCDPGRDPFATGRGFAGVGWGGCVVAAQRDGRFLVRAVGGAVHGSSGQGCFAYRPRISLRTSGYVCSQKLRRSRVV